MILRSTEQIFNNSIEETFDVEWFNKNPYGLPENPKHNEENILSVDDVFLWEAIYEANPYRVYAAWNPFHDTYLIIDQSKYMLISGKFWKQDLEEALLEIGLPKSLHRASWVSPDQFIV